MSVHPLQLLRTSSITSAAAAPLLSLPQKTMLAASPLPLPQSPLPLMPHLLPQNLQRILAREEDNSRGGEFQGGHIIGGKIDAGNKDAGADEEESSSNDSKDSS
ncbi:expressed unknown protein [Seminavis robusta]|uniref:Uncharacterized protein n=1 Tax=Seminavis robusta TaxID=568900 RepID=A0A9N8DDG1_9STRA|nr:expressed unknown protein [Seminavis robusta]|eukprot:Sro39_g024150.1 n/a (104) ;mRNA; f:80154-80465